MKKRKNNLSKSLTPNDNQHQRADADERKQNLKDMTITMTEKEYDAVLFAMDQVETAIEAADDEYVDEASKIVDSLRSIVRKYKAAREKSQRISVCKGIR